jgi:hypothetical protein
MVVCFPHEALMSHAIRHDLRADTDDVTFVLAAATRLYEENDVLYASDSCRCQWAEDIGQESRVERPASGAQIEPPASWGESARVLATCRPVGSCYYYLKNDAGLQRKNMEQSVRTWRLASSRRFSVSDLRQLA